MRELLVFLAMAAAPIASALADCSLRTDVRTEFHQSDFVFVGKVVSAKQLRPKPYEATLFGTSYRLSVIEQFRGTPKEQALIFSENDSGRFWMSVGETYVLFATFDQETLVGPAYAIYNCGFSGVARASPRTLAILRKLTDATPNQSLKPPFAAQLQR